MKRSRTESSFQRTVRPARMISRLLTLIRAVATGARQAAPEMGVFAGLSALSIAAMYFIFPPWTVWPLGFVCLTPWAVAVSRARPWIAHWGSFAAGWVFFLFNLYWMMPVTGLGYVALAWYLALYWTLAAWGIRTARRAGIGAVWSLPVVWVATEFLRGWVMSGFPWSFLAHSFYQVTALTQVADFAGAYGVSFIAAMVNGLLVDVAVASWGGRPGVRPAGRRQLLIGGAATLATVIGALTYGAVRIREARLEPGPRIAVVQEDFVQRSEPPYSEREDVIFSRYMALAAKAAAEKPDIVAFPETVWGAVQNVGFVSAARAIDDQRPDVHAYGLLCHTAISEFARGEYGGVNRLIERFERSFQRVARDQQSRSRLPAPPALPRLPESGPPVTVVVGSTAIDVYPDSTYPKYKKFNSALVYDPDGTQRPVRYDKIHLVPFGEFVPFRNATYMGISFHWLYRRLNELSPFSFGGKVEYSLWPGEQFSTFNFTGTDGRTWRFGTPICYEDTTPYVSRRLAYQDGRKRLDFLLNISNDGWFLHTAELPQHLAICTYRAIENRVGIARSVNTGISGFIDPLGRIQSLIEVDGRTLGPGIVGYRVEPVLTDPRSTVYGIHGDWFAGVCLAGATGLWLGAIFTRWILAIGHRFSRKSPAQG